MIGSFLAFSTEGDSFLSFLTETATVQTNVRTKTGSSLDKPEPIVQVRVLI